MIERQVRPPVVVNSPIEFVLTGPSGGRDRILARSKAAGLDIIGMAAEAAEPKRRRTIEQIAMFVGMSTPIHVLSSSKFDDIDLIPADRRSSSFRLAWKGHAGSSDYEKIERILNLQIPDVRKAIQRDDTVSEDVSDVEFAIAPIVYHCDKANRNRLLNRAAIWFLVALYFLGGAYAVLIQALKRCT